MEPVTIIAICSAIAAAASAASIALQGIALSQTPGNQNPYTLQPLEKNMRSVLALTNALTVLNRLVLLGQRRNFLAEISDADSEALLKALHVTELLIRHLDLSGKDALNVATNFMICRKIVITLDPVLAVIQNIDGSAHAAATIETALSEFKTQHPVIYVRHTCFGLYSCFSGGFVSTHRPSFAHINYQSVDKPHVMSCERWRFVQNTNHVTPHPITTDMNLFVSQCGHDDFCLEKTIGCQDGGVDRNIELRQAPRNFWDGSDGICWEVWKVRIHGQNSLVRDIQLPDIRSGDTIILENTCFPKVAAVGDRHNDTYALRCAWNTDSSTRTRFIIQDVSHID